MQRYNKIMGFIYCITSPSNKKYIGQTKRLYSKRWKEHNKCTGKSILLENAINKYGSNDMIYEVLCEVNDELLNEYEIKFIDIYNTLDPYGYNLRSGGTGGNHTPSSIEKMRLAKTGKNNPNYGIPKSDETKAKISEMKSVEKHHFYGKQLTIEHRLKLAKSHRKTEDNLPMYMVYVKKRPICYQSEGYAIVNHPILKNKYFTSKTVSLDEKYNVALQYLNTHECSSETKW